MKPQLTIALLLSSVTLMCAGYPDKKAIAPPEEDRWRFSLGVPGWMPNVDGTVGINGINSDIDLGFDTLFNKIDMIWATRAEASKGRFGVMGELIYLSASDSLGVGGPIHKVDVRLDEYLADFALRWRIAEGERGYGDIIAGVRYTNLFQHVHLQSDDAGVAETSTQIVDDAANAIRNRLIGILDDPEFRNALSNLVADRIGTRLENTLGADPHRRNLEAVGPVGGRHPARVSLLVENVILEEEARLRSELGDLRVRGAELAAEVRRRVNAAKGRMEKRVANLLEKELNRSFSRGDDWWDPYIGLRARYNLSPTFYFIGRADIGGFGVGSDLMWQAEAALGLQLTPSIHAEFGYRALSLDYDHDGLTYDTITHGFQVTTGIEF
ncbi:MAG TPA: hypothetical protein VFG14_09355 [Chthoniobacteraceae bacterium]|nr:hypothetical protein [Chthoniobacteraceae bacterium]